MDGSGSTVYRICAPSWYNQDMNDPATVPPFPVAGEITEGTWSQVAEGQPVLLLHNGRPAAVIVDLDSWQEAEVAAQTA